MDEITVTSLGGGGGGNAPSGSSVRRRLSPEERMPQILEAALEEFAERGYAGASMTGTAARAGVTKGLIYHYFPSKPELFRAVMRACVQPIFTEVERLAAEFPGPRADLLRNLISLAYERTTCDPREQTVFKLLILEADRFPELAELYRTEVLSRALELVRGVLRAGVESGEFRADVAEAEGTAPVLMAPTIMAAIWQMMLGSGGAPAPAAMQQAHIELVLRGLLNPSGGPDAN